jgi:hypothetical protein
MRLQIQCLRLHTVVDDLILFRSCVPCSRGFRQQRCAFGDVWCANLECTCGRTQVFKNPQTKHNAVVGACVQRKQDFSCLRRLVPKLRGWRVCICTLQQVQEFKKARRVLRAIGPPFPQRLAERTHVTSSRAPAVHSSKQFSTD